MALTLSSGCPIGLKVLMGICGKTFRKSSLLSLIWFVLWWGREETSIFGKIVGWGKDLFVVCFLVCTTSLKSHFVAYFLVWSRSFCSFSFEFRLPFFNREATDMTALLS